MLRNRRGATSLRWLRALLDHGIEVHGQVVVCPGVNDGAVLDDTLAGVLDEYPELAVGRRRAARGQSRFNTEPAMRPHTTAEARGRRRRRRGLAGRLPARRSAAAWCSPPTSTTCWPAARSPPPTRYEGFADARGRHRHGPHVRARVHGEADDTDRRPQPGFFACGRRRPGRRATARRATRPATPALRARRRRRRSRCAPAAPRRARSASSPASYGARGARARCVDRLGRDDVRVRPGRATSSSAATPASPA